MEPGNYSNRGRGTMSQINVTPLVDVMLVLLVIFMMTAPVMQQGVRINLPKADAMALSPREDSVVISLEKSRRLFINKYQVTVGDLPAKLNEIFAKRDKKEIFLKADQDVPYGEVVKVMAEIKGAGIERLGMLTEPAQRE